MKIAYLFASLVFAATASQAQTASSSVALSGMIVPGVEDVGTVGAGNANLTATAAAGSPAC